MFTGPVWTNHKDKGLVLLDEGQPLACAAPAPDGETWMWWVVLALEAYGQTASDELDALRQAETALGLDPCPRYRGLALDPDDLPELKA